MIKHKISLTLFLFCLLFVFITSASAQVEDSATEEDTTSGEGSETKSGGVMDSLFKALGSAAQDSLKEEIEPRDIVFSDQFFDRTHRKNTFFGEGIAAHISFAYPVCLGLSRLVQVCKTGSETLYNQQNHTATDGIINDEVLDNIDKINIYPINIESEKDLAREIARIANLSIKKGYQIEDEKRLLTKEEAYEQIRHSASLFRAILKYVEKVDSR